MKVSTLKSYLDKVQCRLDLRPVLLLALMYGVIAFLPFGIFGWLQNEDGLMEWGSVALLILSALMRLPTKAIRMDGNEWDGCCFLSSAVYL